MGEPFRDEEVSIRPLIGADIDFVYSSWIQSETRPGTEWGSLPRALYFERVRPIIDRTIRACGVHFAVACNAEDSDQVLGWAALEDLGGLGVVIHYAYVKDPFRRKGIASRLVGHLRGRRVYHVVRAPRLASRNLAQKLCSTYQPFLRR